MAGEGDVVSQLLVGQVADLRTRVRKTIDFIQSVSRAELARLESLAHSAAEAAGVFAAPTDAELQSAYQRFVVDRKSVV